ncbi:MAG: radical SAM family heme chaperone HemW [Pirellulales bacterium]|nr:radical SAM family heme chaperone HemW [Pirellulales bacterium]
MSDHPLIPPRAAYVHVPFCDRKCGYCNFTAIAGRDGWIDRYLRAIEIELSWLGESQEVDTLYFGGGTPSHLAAGQLARLFDTVLRWFPLADGSEWTVEANPNDLDAERSAVLAEYGVNRISVGAQSFDEWKLNQLERNHRGADIRRAADVVRSIDADLAIDLIFAVPKSRSGGSSAWSTEMGETFATWQRDLDSAIELAPDHLSVYGLTIERGSAFYGRRVRGDLVELPEEIQRAMVLEAIDRLTAAGYEHYEISNFARWLHRKEGTEDTRMAGSQFQRSARSRHNQIYWQGAPYHAAGPGAARYVHGCRETNHRSTAKYLQRVLDGQSPVAEWEMLDPESRAREMLVLALRQMDGISRDDFSNRTGFILDDLVRPAIRRFIELGFLADDGEKIRLTREGLLISDALWPEFL